MHKLEYTDIFTEYEALVEGLLVSFVERENAGLHGAKAATSHRFAKEVRKLDNATAFYQRLERLVKINDNVQAAAALSLLLSASEYRTFVEMMRERNRTLGGSYAMEKTANKRNRD